METILTLAQHEVQQKLGRCMLRLQQYERSLKSMVAEMAVQGPLEQLQRVRDKQAFDVRNKTLGTLISMFTDRHLIANEDTQGQLDEDADSELQNFDGSWARISFSFSMSQEQYAETKAALVELVHLRNYLVHHLIERFNISNEDDCQAASSYLDSCYERIDNHCQRLKMWAAAIDESKMRLSSFMQSKVFRDAFEHGLNPDGSICWPRSSIVEHLRDAEAAHSVDGWTPLNAAIEYISKEHRDQIPSKYGCKTWRQILKKSEQFELRTVAATDEKAGQAWYRSCANV